MGYLRDYKEGGTSKLKELTFNRPQSELKKHQESLEIYFREHPPKTLAHAAATITEMTGIVRSREQVHHFLKSMGMSCHRVCCCSLCPWSLFRLFVVLNACLSNLEREGRVLMSLGPLMLLLMK